MDSFHVFGFCCWSCFAWFFGCLGDGWQGTVADFEREVLLNLLSLFGKTGMIHLRISVEVLIGKDRVFDLHLLLHVCFELLFLCPNFLEKRRNDFGFRFCRCFFPNSVWVLVDVELLWLRRLDPGRALLNVVS